MFARRGDLEVFVRIFEARSLSAAAEAMRMTPGMVSKRLAQLEHELGARLFHRTTRQVQPTDEGRRFYAQAQQLLEAMSAFEQEWRPQAEPTGLLRVTASASFARLYLVPLVARFLARHPQVRIDLDLTDRVIDIVAEGIDLAIRIDRLPDSSLIARKLGSNRQVLCATPRYLKRAGTPQTPAELAAHNCVVLHQYGEWVFEKDGRKYSQRVRGSFQTNYGEAMVQAVKNSVGIGAASIWHVRRELDAGELLPLLPGYRLANPRAIYALYPSRQLPLKTLAFLEYLQKNLAIPE